MLCRGVQQASLQVALHVTKRRHGVTASDRGNVDDGADASSYSHEALSIQASGSRLGSLSIPRIVGKASKECAGHPLVREAGARQPKQCVSIRRIAFVALIGLAAVLLGCSIEKTSLEGRVMILIRIKSGGGSSGVQQASLQVALHVTKRQNGVTASDRGNVDDGADASSYSHEALSIQASGSP